MNTVRLQNLAAKAAGIAGVLLAWQAIGALRLAGAEWPSLTEVLSYIVDPANSGLVLRATLGTLRSASVGFCVGGSLALALAALTQLAPELKTGADRLNVAIHSIPVFALGAIFIVLFGLDAAGAAMAAAASFFTFYVTFTAGFSAISTAHADLMKALGAAPSRHFVYLTLPAAAPALATAAKLAIPRALLGAIMGEWFGASSGLGVLMATGMHEARTAMLWSGVLVITVLSVVLFALASWLEQALRERFE